MEGLKSAVGRLRQQVVFPQGGAAVEITEVRIKLSDESQERLLAFCSITIDGCFVVRDLKIIQGTKGPFVAMPSRKLTDRCMRCQYKNCLRAVYCGQCGARLPVRRAARCQPTSRIPSIRRAGKRFSRT
jgi:DNA-binding cell septation regulator SpoVG